MPQNTNYYYGLQMRWATNGVSAIAFGVNSLIQNIDHERQSAQALYPNQLGNTAIAVLYDFKSRGTFTYIPSNTVTADGTLATSNFQPVVGSPITIVDSLDTNNHINNTNWKVESVSERRTSTGVAEIVVSAMSWDAIA
jgi:hypothetical protein